MADGFKANAAFFKLGFLDRTAVSLGRKFKEILPLLWMKTGATGKRPQLENEPSGGMLLLPENHFAVLLDEKKFLDFRDALEDLPQIKTVFFVTDSGAGYRDMAGCLHHKETFQLYRDYLDHFRLNTVRR